MGVILTILGILMLPAILEDDQNWDYDCFEE